MSDYHKDSLSNDMADFLEQYQMVHPSKSVAPLVSHASRAPLNLRQVLHHHQLLDQVDFTSPLPQHSFCSKEFYPEYLSLLKDFIDTLPEELPDIKEESLPTQALNLYSLYQDIQLYRLPLLPELITSYSYQDIFVNYINKGVDSPKNLLTTLRRRRTILFKKLRYRALLEVYLLYLSTVFMRLSNSVSVDWSVLFEVECCVRERLNEQISILGFLPVSS
jgi:hypothetical protein